MPTVLIMVYGTTGELIKLAPVIKRLQSRDLDFLTISTQQQPEQVEPMHRQFGIPGPDVLLADGRGGHDLANRRDIPGWAATLVRSATRERAEVRRRMSRTAGRHVVMVHGDTFTTVIGGIFGRALRLPVAHLEAGLRSGNWRHPFPEELNRRAVGKLSTIHYAPTERDAWNLRKARGDVVVLGANTVIDSLDLVPDGTLPSHDALGGYALPARFGLASIHRFELLARPDRLRELLILLGEESRRVPLVFIDHPITVEAIRRHRLDSLLDTPGIRRVPRQSYVDFVALLKLSDFAVTDSGGLQEECYYLDHPCLVHRVATERRQGLDTNVVLTGFDLDRARAFFADPHKWRTGRRPEFSRPSDRVIDDLVNRKVWASDATRRLRTA